MRRRHGAATHLAASARSGAQSTGRSSFASRRSQEQVRRVRASPPTLSGASNATSTLSNPWRPSSSSNSAHRLVQVGEHRVERNLIVTPATSFPVALSHHIGRATLHFTVLISRPAERADFYPIDCPYAPRERRRSIVGTLIRDYDQAMAPSTLAATARWPKTASRQARGRPTSQLQQVRPLAPATSHGRHRS
jgi:hypothetical protein